MAFISGRCPYCHSDQIVKRGKTGCGTQRYLCHNTTCATGSFLLDYRDLGRRPEVKPQIIALSLNARGLRDTARVLRLSTETVLRELRKQETARESVHTACLRTPTPADLAVAIERAGEEAAMDARWSFVGNTGHPRWLWHASDHHTGAVLAYGFGHRKDAGLLRLKALLEPCGLTCFYPDHWGAHTRHLDPDVPSPGKRHTQKIARQPLTWRTRMRRLARKTSVAPNRRRCTTSSLACWSTAMPLDCWSTVALSTSRTPPSGFSPM